MHREKVQNSVYFDALAVSYSKKQVGKQRGAKYTEHHGVVFEFLQAGLIHLSWEFLSFLLKFKFRNGFQLREMHIWGAEFGFGCFTKRVFGKAGLQ